MKACCTLVLACVVLVVAANPASACEPPPCIGGATLPSNGALVPATLEGILWSPAHVPYAPPAVTAANVRLVAAQDGGVPGGVNVEVELRDAGVGTFLVVPLQPLAAGQEYRLHVDTFCNGPNSPEAVVAFGTQAAAALPTSLGALVASGPPQVGELDVYTASGSCSAVTTSSFVRVATELEASAQPWKDAFRYQTYVDGQPYWHQSFLVSDPLVTGGGGGTGADRIFTVCSTDDPGPFDGLEPGLHTVEMRGTLVGLGAPLVSSQLTIELVCPPVVQDAGLPTGADAAAVGLDAATVGLDGAAMGLDAAVVVLDAAGVGQDAGAEGVDAAAPRDAGSGTDSGVAAAGGSNCTCDATSSGPTPLLALMLLWGGVEARRRRLQRGRTELLP